MSAFTNRLQAAARAGRMTTADLATWFDRPYSTVRSWLQKGHEPWGPAGEASQELLVALEKLIAKRDGFPVPINLSPPERQRHVREARHEHNARLSRTRSSA